MRIWRDFVKPAVCVQIAIGVLFGIDAMTFASGLMIAGCVVVFAAICAMFLFAFIADIR